MLDLGRVTKSLGFKIFLVGILILIMLIPVALVVRVVHERARRAEMVENEIVEAWGGTLSIAGPVMKVPCRRIEKFKKVDADGHETIETREVSFTLWITPSRMEINGDFVSSEKTRGIFSVPVFHGDLAFNGEFDTTDAFNELKADEYPLPEEIEIILAIENQKGIRSLKQASLGGQDIVFSPGDSGLNLLSGGIKAKAPLKTIENFKEPFNIGLTLQGGGQMTFLPLAGETEVLLGSDWVAPSYQGNYLPTEQSLDDDGFEAFWRISNLSRGIPLFWTGNLQEGGQFYNSFFGVDFLKVLDRYGKNERAVKYTILFIIVPFMTLFLFEVFWKMGIHPVQYILAGTGNVIFYLLLLSLSEHMNFNLAYLIGALAVTGMMFLYSTTLVREIKKALYMIPVMVLSYLYLFITLQSEDWALLIGSIGAFIIIGVIMFITRNVDWYGGRNRIDR
ncbi:MAG: cell envelope integrity protein CreD [Spirochaetales bacterium]|nr:cell envelope integrity protein CreD [Spirochaetales bacterium]